MIRTGKAGKGTYGIVYTADSLDKSGIKKVAVKRNIVDSSISFSGSIKELDLLNRLKGHPYIVKLLAVNFGNPFTTPNSPIGGHGGSTFKEDYLYFIFEQASKNIHEIIHSPSIHISYLKLAMVQVLLGVEYMHSKSIIHRDLKPANLLWFVEDSKATIKICDFGLSKIHTSQTPSTPRVVTCWYRAPEICSRDSTYSFASDMWSVGCVFFEMIAKRALLQNYKDDDTEILSRIIGLIPSPSYDDIFKLTKGHQITLTDDASPRSRKSLKEMISLTSEKVEEFNTYPSVGASYTEFIDLLGKIIVLDPDKRITAAQALEHPFFKPYKDIITWTRNNYIPEPIPEPKISVISCRERSWACNAAFSIFNTREGLPWYSHRILFQSLDLFDRYIYHLHINTVKYNIPSKDQGKYMNRYETKLRFLVCFYICVKYFTTLHIPISFTDLVSTTYKTSKALMIAEDFEKKILNIVRYKVYRETVFEAADKFNDKLDEYKIRDMLSRYGKLTTIEDVSLTELYHKVRNIPLPVYVDSNIIKTLPIFVSKEFKITLPEPVRYSSVI